MKDVPIKPVQDLARQLMLARRPHPKQGRAVFLVGAGCSVSAGIPASAEIARLCAVHLANYFSQANVPSTPSRPESLNGEEALELLMERGFVGREAVSAGAPDWGRLYTYFFDEHLRSINAQRDVIAEAVSKGDSRLNWAHACLGELVRCRYVHTVLTTNFDQLVLLGVIRAGTLPVVADGLEALARVTAEPRYPQIVHLHGSMHTYNPRSSRRAITETEDDPLLGSMLTSVLQLCDLLVVVGYGGREEGVMTLLTEASKQLPLTQVFWILRPVDQLSAAAQRFMEVGDNKFIVMAEDADTFFREVMNEMHLGQPRWIADPIGSLVERRNEIVVPAGDIELETALADYRRRIDFASANPAPDSSELARSASLRLQKGSKELLANLASIDRHTADPEVVRMRGLTWLNIAQEHDDIHSAAEAVLDLEAVIQRTTGRKLELAYLQLFEARMRAYELTGDLGILEALLDHASQTNALFGQEDSAKDWIRLHMLRAQALVTLGQQKESNAELVLAADMYRRILQRATAIADIVLLDAARSELANVLQLSGEFGNDHELLRESLDLQRQLTAHGSGVDALTRAGRLMNFSGTCLALAKLGSDQPRPLLQEARSLMKEVISIYEREDGSGGGNLDAAREMLQQIEDELAA